MTYIDNREGNGIMRKLNREKEKNIVKIFILFLVIVCISQSTVTAHAAKNKFVQKAGKTYYYNAKGKKVKGLKKIKSKYYFFGKKGVLYKKGWKIVKGSKYYFTKKNGSAVTGPKKIGRKTYLFSSKGKRYKTGLVMYKKKLYYTKKGVIQTSLQKIGKKVYFFTASGTAKVGWYTYQGSKYYFGLDGAAYTGTRMIDGVRYQFDSNGKFIKKGSASIDADAGSEDDSGKAIDQATAIDGVWLKCAIDDFHKKIDRFKSNGLTLTAAANLVVLQLSDKNSTYQDMIINYSRYSKAQIQAAEREVEAMIDKLKVEIELVYYPEQSKAILSAVNAYRTTLGKKHFSWSEKLSKIARLESGYYCYTYPEGNYLNAHGTSQLSACMYTGLAGVSGIMESWKGSSMHKPTLESGYEYAATAYYSCNDEDGGVWSKVIFIGYANETDVSTTCPSGYEKLILDCKLKSEVYR